jgi:hypothetical protein
MIGLYRLLQALPRAHLPASVAVYVCLAWSIADNYLDAVKYEHFTGGIDLRTRLYVLAQANGRTLTEAELKEVYPFPEIRSVIQYTIDRRWTIFAEGDNSYEFHNELPSLAFGTAGGNVVDGVLEFTGAGHLYNEHPCPFAEGCAVQLSVEAQTTGLGTVGIILLDETGVQYDNLNVRISQQETFAHCSLRGVVKPGSTMRPYVYAASPRDSVRVQRFSVGILKYTPPP